MVVREVIHVLQEKAVRSQKLWSTVVITTTSLSSIVSLAAKEISTLTLNIDCFQNLSLDDIV